MALFCLCEKQTPSTPWNDGQVFMAPNQMRLIAMGVTQVILKDSKPNDYADPMRPLDYHVHLLKTLVYPNVDVFECPNCRARVVRQ